MDQFQWANMGMEFMKNSFETSMNMLVSVQDQWIKMLSMMLDQNLATQQEGRKRLEEWIEKAKKGQEDYRKMMIENLDKVREAFPKPK